MVEYSSHVSCLCKERSLIIGIVNYLAWNKRIDLILTEQDVKGYATREITEPRIDKKQELTRYNKGELRSQMIIIESIKDFFIPFVENLKTTKAMYTNLVNLYSVSTIGQIMSLKKNLYKLNKLKDEDMTSFLMIIS